MHELKKIFCKANNKFLFKEIELLKSDVSERCICSTLKNYIEYEIRKSVKYKDYYVDTEYNRNACHVKTIINNDFRIVRITCDLIVHSRGKRKNDDNLIALEIKKSYRPLKEKNADRTRLIALTMPLDEDKIWSFDGKTDPEHVCGYALGIYYEINLLKELILIEYYCRGKMVENHQQSLLIKTNEDNLE